jgi:gliding motility-associated-like protein
MEFFKKILKAIMLICLLYGSSFRLMAENPGWSVDASKFTNTMVVLGALNFDRVESMDKNDKIAAFINGECRGVVSPMFIEKANRYIAYLIIYNNESSGTVSFKMYDASADKVVDGAKKLNFEVDGLVGDADRPFVWCNLELKTEASFLTFTSLKQMKPAVFEAGKIFLEIAPDADITEMHPTFSVSEGATAYINKVKQVSGTSEVNFTEPVTYTVRSEDEQTFVDYVVTVFHLTKELPVTNFISPNGDSYNDFWKIDNINFYNGFVLKIFDSNGSTVYSSTNYQNEWQGQNYKGDILPNGVYYYQFKSSTVEYKGTVQLYR